MDIRELQREAHEVARDKGWWDKKRSFGDLIALIHSELSEALEAYRERGLDEWHSPDNPRKPEGVASELADVVIRVADMAEHYGMDLAAVIARAGVNVPSHNLSFGDHIAACHSYLSQAWSVRPGSLGAGDWSIPIAWLIQVVQHIAAHYGIDLNGAIEAKMEYNRSRLYRHGGKAL